MATALTGANQQTEWWDLTAASSDILFILEGDFADAVSVHYSNKPDYAKGVNDYIVDAVTYATKGTVVIPFGTARFVRFASGGSWTGTKVCTPRPSVGLTGRSFVPTTQAATFGQMV